MIRTFTLAGVISAVLLTSALAAGPDTSTGDRPDDHLKAAERAMALDGGASAHGSFLFRLKPAIAQLARAHGVKASVIMAIVKNTSGFDPAAETDWGAVGLLPLVPAEGGRIAAGLLTGKAQVPAAETLLDPEASLIYGVAYLRHLQDEVFGTINDSISRELIVIAAYRGGVTAVARAFHAGAEVKSMIRLINRMSSPEVRLRLIQRLRAKEVMEFTVQVSEDVRRWEGLALARTLNRRMGLGETDAPSVAALPPENVEREAPAARSPNKQPPSAAVARRTEDPPAADRSERTKLALESLKGPVLASARRFGLAPSLILSVIKNESAFDPNALSAAGAMGLMQLMPETAGRDALSYLQGLDGTQARPSEAALFNPEANIELGATYLHLLANRHFRDVTDEDSRRLAVIAAYHAGLGTLARSLTGSHKMAGLVARLNELTPAELYRQLMHRLPAMESKSYILNVTRDLPRFADWDELV